ncbi:MAG: helix-turn-helix domain-containing protein [Phycisphaerales bacterium]|nr:helix-turn-helix domain-containing protein [Phycisphaerales bacterium]
MKKYIVTLTPEEQAQLKTLVKTGKAAAYRIRHAHVLLAVDASEGAPQLTDDQVAKTLDITTRSIAHLRQRFVEEGFNAALERKKRELPPREQLFDGEKEARLIATACGPAPEGRVRWTLELLADRMVALRIVEHCSPQTIMRTLKKTNQLKSLGRKKCGASLQKTTPPPPVVCLRDGERFKRL